MFYATERDLQQELAQVDFNFYKSYPVSFFRREVPVGGCIPDLVSIHFTHDPAILDWPNKWSYRHSFLIWLLKKWDKLTLQRIASLSYESSDKLQIILDELGVSGLISKDNQGMFSLASHVKQFDAEVVAIEAKLRKWRDALSQAIRYKEFANIVFVAMDADAVPRSPDILSKFDSQQIGLSAISRGSVEWLVYPDIRQYGVGHEKAYLVMSAAIPATQKFWARRNERNAANHA